MVTRAEAAARNKLTGSVDAELFVVGPEIPEIPLTKLPKPLGMVEESDCLLVGRSALHLSVVHMHRLPVNVMATSGGSGIMPATDSKDQH